MAKPAKKSFKRSLRVQDRIREDVADLLLKKVRDPRIGFVTITAVDLSDDLKNAKVYVSVMGEQSIVEKTMEGLTASEGFVQREVWRRLEIKSRPVIHFKLDSSAREGAKMDAIFKKLSDEREAVSGKNNVSAVAQAIRSAKKIMVSTHINPDGDGLGCESALVRGLRSLGKETFVVNQDEAPSRYDLLKLNSLMASQDEKGWDLGITVDAPVLHRIGDAAEKIKACPQVIKIDHHVSDDTFGDINWVDAEAAATGEMIYQLFEELDITLDADMATGLYYAIVHDTGCFRYSNTTAQTLEYAAKLVAAGAESFKINTAMFDTRPLGAVKLAGEVLAKIELLSEGKAVVGTVSLQQLEKCGATKDDTEDLVEAMRSIAGVEVSVFLREDAPGQIKASFRSKYDINVREIAEIFGGGGHNKAAGATIHETMDLVRQKVIVEVEKKLA